MPRPPLGSTHQRMERITRMEETNNDLNGRLLYSNESYAIRGALMEVHRVVGVGFLEDVYQDCLRRELLARSIPFEEKPRLRILYKGEEIEHHYVPDFICYGKLIVEIKAIATLSDEHYAQLRNYLRATKFRVGFLVNFHDFPKLDIHRMIV